MLIVAARNAACEACEIRDYCRGTQSGCEAGEAGVI